MAAPSVRRPSSVTGRRREGAGKRQPQSVVLDKQRDRQRRLRDEAKAARRPSRDDVARMFLHHALSSSLQDPKKEALLDRLLDKLEGLLVEQGFDKAQTGAVLDDLVERTRRGWIPQRKEHLMPDPGNDSDTLALKAILEKGKLPDRRRRKD